jgi:hypothetical protein
MQALQVTLTVFIVEKARQPIVAPLHDVLGNAGKIGAGSACHADSFAADRAQADQSKPGNRLVQLPDSMSEIVPDTILLSRGVHWSCGERYQLEIQHEYSPERGTCS